MRDEVEKGSGAHSSGREVGARPTTWPTIQTCFAAYIYPYHASDSSLPVRSHPFAPHHHPTEHRLVYP